MKTIEERAKEYADRLKSAKWVLEEIGDISTMSKIEIVNAIVGKVFEYSKKELCQK